MYFLNQSNQRYILGLKKGLSVHCRVWLWDLISYLDSWDSVHAENGITCQDWTNSTRYTYWVLKRVLVRIAALCCARRPQIWIPETEYYQKVSSHAQIGPQGAEKQLRKVVVGGWVGGWWWWVFGQRPEQLLLRIRSDQRSLSIWKK